MNRRRTAWFVAAAILTLIVSFSAPAFPVEDPTPAQPAQATPTESAVEAILQQQEDLLRGKQFGYDPEDRRDPFRSLITKVEEGGEKRPLGIAGMTISEISLDGIVREPDSSAIAFFTGSDNKGYFLRTGDKVYDARLIAIDPKQGTVTFRQEINDPRIVKPYRDVVRRLVTTEEK